MLGFVLLWAEEEPLFVVKAPNTVVRRSHSERGHLSGCVKDKMKLLTRENTMSLRAGCSQCAHQ